MYLPSHFEERRPEVLQALMQSHPLATLVTLTSTGLVANHIPMQLHASATGSGILRGPVAPANPLCSDLVDGVEALAIFQGPDHYISPTWYPTKREHGKVVPTWNYCTVHAYGALRVHQDVGWIRSQVEALTAWQEASQLQPWSVADAPRDFVDSMLRQIVGLEITVTRLVGKWKVSQNQPASNRAGAAAALANSADADAAAMSALIREHQPR